MDKPMTHGVNIGRLVLQGIACKKERYHEVSAKHPFGTNVVRDFVRLT